MIHIFDDEIDLAKITCHSGGAPGSDTYWEKMGEKVGIKVKAYSYKTKYHTSPNKVEISEDDYQEGIIQVNRANHWLNRYGIHKYMNLLARNWAQVKYSKQIIAIGTIVNPGEKSSKGYRSNAKYQSVDGGTGYAVQMGIDNLKEVYVFDQVKEKWFRWSYSSMSFIETTCPKILAQDFAGIGTREINVAGINAIKDVYKKTFNL
jgi:hypothetical protein